MTSLLIWWLPALAGDVATGAVVVDTPELLQVSFADQTPRPDKPAIASSTRQIAPSAQLPRALNFKHITVEDGLPTGYVNSILQDQKGFMWFGDIGGLVRYDGRHLKTFRADSETPNTLIHNQIWDLHLARDGTIWIATNGGLSQLDPRTESFTSFAPEPQEKNPSGLHGSRFPSVYEDKDGMIWTGTWDGVLNVLDPARGQFRHYSARSGEDGGLADSRILVIQEDGAGTLWVGQYLGLHRFDREQDRFVRYPHDPSDPSKLPDHRVRELFVDAQGVLWIATYSGLSRYDRERDSFTTYRHAPNDPNSSGPGMPYAITEDLLGRLWVGTFRGGFSLFDRESNRFRSYGHNPADRTTIGSMSINTVYRDRSGVIWIGTFGSGISVWSPRAERMRRYVSDVTNPQSLPKQHVSAVFEDRTGLLWLGCRQGLARFDPVSDRFTRYPLDSLGLAGTQPVITAFCEDGAEQLWIGCNVGLYVINKNGDLIASYQHDPKDPGSVSNNGIQDIHRDAASRIWVGTKDGLNLCDSQSGRFTRFYHEPGNPGGLSHSSIRFVDHDTAGNLWIGTGNGLNRLDDETRFIRYSTCTTEEGSSEVGFVNDMLVTAYGDLLFGSQTGLLRWDATLDRLESHLATATGVRCVFEDEKQRIWMSCFRGKVVYDPHTDQIVHLGQGHGFGFNSHDRRSGTKARDGNLYFGGTHGLDRIYPDRVQFDTSPPPVAITRVSLFHKEVPIGQMSDGRTLLDKHVAYADQLTLNHDHNVLSFEFAVLHYGAPEANQYSVMMEGLEQEWRNLGNQRTAHYPNMPPGEYVFRVKGANNDGTWNEEGAALRIIIRPPFWATWWFRCCMLAAGLLVLGFGYVARMQAVLRRSRMLERRVRERTAQLEEKTSELKVANDRLREIDRLKSMFVASMSHELRTPLNSIIGFTGIVLQGMSGELTDKQRDHLSRSYGSAKHLLELITDVIDISKIEAGRTDLFPSECVLSEVVDEAVESVRPQAENKGLGLTVTMPEDCVLYTDRRRLLQCLLNFLSNAVKYSETGEIALCATERGEDIEIAVSDTGIGIAEKDMPKVFEAFERLDSHLRVPAGGTGLGLHLTRKIATDLLEGSVSVHSEIGKGSTFTLRIPKHLKRDDDLAAAQGEMP